MSRLGLKYVLLQSLHSVADLVQSEICRHKSLSSTFFLKCNIIQHLCAINAILCMGPQWVCMQGKDPFPEMTQWHLSMGEPWQLKVQVFIARERIWQSPQKLTEKKGWWKAELLRFWSSPSTPFSSTFFPVSQLTWGHRSLGSHTSAPVFALGMPGPQKPVVMIHSEKIRFFLLLSYSFLIYYSLQRDTHPWMSRLQNQWPQLLLF